MSPTIISNHLGIPGVPSKCQVFGYSLAQHFQSKLHHETFLHIAAVFSTCWSAASPCYAEWTSQHGVIGTQELSKTQKLEQRLVISRVSVKSEVQG